MENIWKSVSLVVFLVNHQIHDLSSQWVDHQCIVLYVGIHFYSEYDVTLLTNSFTSFFKTRECKFPVQGLEIQTYSSRYQAIMIQLQRQQYFTKLFCNQHCSSSLRPSRGYLHFLCSRFPIRGMEQIIGVYLLHQHNHVRFSHFCPLCACTPTMSWSQIRSVTSCRQWTHISFFILTHKA